MHRQIIIFSAALLAAAPAFAGDIAPTVMEPAPVAPLAAAPASPVVTSAGDWTGFYLGVQAGAASLDYGTDHYNGTVLGAHAGYLHDFGGIVAGGELRYDDLSNLSGMNDRVSIVTGEFRLGYDMGRLLPYVALGGAQVTNHTTGDNSSGPVYGLGADFALTDRWRLGAEATHLDLDSSSSAPLTGTNLGLSVSFSF